MARLVENQVADIKKGLSPPKHWGSREYVYKRELLKKRKAARLRKKSARRK